MAKKDGTENLGLGNRDREVEELLDVQDDTKIEKQGGSVATGAIPKKRSSEPPNREWAQLQQTSSIINIDLVSEEVNAHKDVMVTGIVARHRDFSGLHVPPPVPLHKRRTASAPKVTLGEKHHSIKHPGYPSSLINQQPPMHDREAVSEEDGVNSRQENILMMGQDTNVTATSQSQQLAPRCTSTTLEENDITNDGLVRNLKKENNSLRENQMELVKELSSLKHDLRKKTEELLHATTQAEECRSRCAQLEEQMEERGIANESYAIRISNLQRRYEELQSHVVEIGIAMADKNETIRILQEECNRLSEECERLRERVPVPIPEDVD